SNQVIPLDGGEPIRLGTIGWNWASDGRSMAIFAGARSYIVELAPGRALPQFPAPGPITEQDVAALPGARRVEESWVLPGPSSDVYSFYRSSVHRNLYRVPIP